MNEFINTWLDLQCRMIAGASKGVLFLGTQKSGPRKAVAFWPEAMDVPEEMTHIAQDAFAQSKAVTRASEDAGDKPQDTVAFPVQINGNALGVLTIQLSSRTEEQRRAVIQLLQWGTAWLELLLHQQPSARHDRVVRVLDLVAKAVDQKHFNAAVTAVATELAHRMACEQVSIGFVAGKRMRVHGAAYSARFGERTNIMRAMASAMQEAWHMDATIVFPPAHEVTSDFCPQHAALASEPEIGFICTVPFSAHGEILGAVTFVRGAGEEFDAETVQFCEHIASLIGPVLDIKRRDDRWLGTRFMDGAKHLFGLVFGTGHSGLKAAVMLVGALLAFMVFTTGTYRVTANAKLEGSVQRAIVAPIEGYIETADVRPGDIVQKGQIMAQLDDKDLELEYTKWITEKAKLQREYRSALAQRDRSEVSILSAQLEQAKVNLQLVKEQLGRTELTAPFEGVVVAGDPSQSLGAPVERGEVIYTLAPLQQYRVILQVDERDISQLQDGQKGTLTLSSLPGETQEIEVVRITPVASVEDGRNQFRVEATLMDNGDRLRPGMEGVGKINIDERRWLWIWTHRLTDWLRLATWSWLP